MSTRRPCCPPTWTGRTAPQSRNYRPQSHTCGWWSTGLQAWRSLFGSGVSRSRAGRAQPPHAIAARSCGAGTSSGGSTLGGWTSTKRCGDQGRGPLLRGCCPVKKIRKEPRAVLHSLLPRVRRSRRKSRQHRLLVLKNPASSVEQQQPGKPAANAGQGTLALSSAVGTGQIALAKVGGSAGKPAQQPQLAIRRDVLNPLLDACTWDHATGAWLTPATEPDARLCGIDWRNMLKLPPGWTPTNFVPTFFHDEPDPNQRDKPRLDIVVSFGNGHSVRYHPSADPIWSTSPQPTDAMQKRYNRANNIGWRGK